VGKFQSSLRSCELTIVDCGASWSAFSQRRPGSSVASPGDRPEGLARRRSPRTRRPRSRFAAFAIPARCDASRTGPSLTESMSPSNQWRMTPRSTHGQERSTDLARASGDPPHGRGDGPLRHPGQAGLRRADGTAAVAPEAPGPGPRPVAGLVGERLVRGAAAGRARRRPAARDAPADERLGRPLRELGRLRHGLLLSLRPDASGVGEVAPVVDFKSRVRQAGRLRAHGLPGSPRQGRSRAELPGPAAPHREGRGRRAQLREEGRELGSSRDRKAQSPAQCRRAGSGPASGAVGGTGVPMGRPGRAARAREPQGALAAGPPRPRTPADAASGRYSRSARRRA